MARLKRLTAFALLLVAVLVGGCSERAQREVLSGGTMGTSWSVVYAPTGTASPEELQNAIERELEQINQALSTYIPDAEISRLNDAEGDVSVTLSERFATVLDAALRVGELTDGAYDITVGPLVELWGFGPQMREATVPAVAAIEEARARVGSAALVWDAQTRVLERPAGVRIDLSSIAKGYAVDRLSALLLERGISSSLVEIGGELRARGDRPEGGPWRLAVESPEPGERRFIEAISIGDGGVATSGDYRNYFEIDGQRFSHLVDPRSGYPVAHELVSVTVIHEQCMIADALATALIVLGREDAIALAEAEGLAAHFVSRGADALEVHYTPAFEQYRQSTAERDPS